MLGAEGRVVASDLAERLGVSLDTVRRDLDALDAAGALRRVRGGALPLVRVQRDFAARRHDDPAGKDALAAAGASLLPPAGVVCVAGGTTLLSLARRWPAGFGGTVVTTSPDVALALPPGVEVVLPGGRLHPQARTLVGAETVEALRGVRADVCVLGACSIDPERGLGIVPREEAQVMAAMVAGAARTIAVAGAAKVGHADAFQVAPAGALSVLVTDAPPAATAPFEALGVEVVRP